MQEKAAEGCCRHRRQPERLRQGAQTSRASHSLLSPSGGGLGLGLRVRLCVVSVCEKERERDKGQNGGRGGGEGEREMKWGRESLVV